MIRKIPAPPGGNHHYGDGCRTGHLPVHALADFIVAKGWSDPDPELWADIDANPALYLPELEFFLAEVYSDDSWTQAASA